MTDLVARHQPHVKRIFWDTCWQVSQPSFPIIRHPAFSVQHIMVLTSSSTDSQTSSSTHSHMDSSNEMVTQQLSVAKTVLLQAIDLLDNYLVSDQQLTVQSQFMPGSTIGFRISLCPKSLSLTVFSQASIYAMHAIISSCSSDASWTLLLEFYRTIQEYVILQWKQAVLLLEPLSWIPSSSSKRSFLPRTSKNRYLYMLSRHTCILSKRQLGERWATPHLLSCSWPMSDSYGSPVYTAYTTGRWWVARLRLGWYPTDSTSQVRVIAGELVGNGSLMDEILLTCSFRVLN